MFQRILVAVDKSPVSRVAYARAIALARSLNAKLMVFHVLFEHEAGSPEIPVTAALPYVTEFNDALRKNYQQQWQSFEAEYTEYIRWMAEAARLEGVDTEFSQSMGDPGRSICEFAREWRADLIVMGSQGRSGLSEIFLGSVSNHVTHHAPCSVLVVHQGDRLTGASSDLSQSQEDLLSMG